MMYITRDQEEIDSLENELSTIIDEGGSRFPGMIYEEGVQAALNWLTGDGADPLED